MKAVRFDRLRRRRRPGGRRRRGARRRPRARSWCASRRTGINPGEAAIRSGALRERWPATFPSGEGSDLAGVVTEVGAGVEDGVSVGDEVIGYTDERASHAELVAVDAGHLTPRPGAVPWEVAGSLYVVGATAYSRRARCEPARGRRRRRVLGAPQAGWGPSSCSSARDAGATVVGLASEDHHDWLREHGALPVTYGDGVAERLREAAGGQVDAFIDLFGSGYVELAIELGVAPGRIDTIADPRAPERQPGRQGRRQHGGREPRDAGRARRARRRGAAWRCRSPACTRWPRCARPTPSSSAATRSARSCCGRDMTGHMSERLSVCIAGATGWTGRALVRGVLDAPDLTLRSAVARSAAGRDLGEALGDAALGVPVHGAVAGALDGVDVLIDYTSATAVKPNTLAAIEAGVAVVIGTSGLTADDYAEIDAAARERSVGVVASGNFSLTAAMAQAAALLAARHLPHWEVIDYASATKPDVPSGHRAGARGAPRRGPRACARASDRGPPRPARGARRDGRGDAGPLGPRPELRRVDRDRVRAARRAPDHPPRRGRLARAVRRGDADRGAPGARHRRPDARPRHAAARVRLRPARGAAAARSARSPPCRAAPAR